MCILERDKPPSPSLGKQGLNIDDREQAVKTALEMEKYKRAEHSLALLSLGDAEAPAILDGHLAPAHLRRAKAYEALGKLERAQEAAMQALLLQPHNDDFFQKVQSLTRDIGLTDYGIGPSPEQLAKEGAGALVGWTKEEAPAQWYRKETTEMMEKSLPYTALHALELAVHARVLPEEVLKKKTRLCLHLAGASSELEGLSDFSFIFEKLPHLEELEVVQVGWVGLMGPCKRMVSDPQAPPAGRLVCETKCLGNGCRLRVRRWKGLYHDFVRHEFDGTGYLHEPPDLVLLANPSLDFFFDSWAPTLACLRDAGYLTVLTGGNLDHSRRHHNLILPAMGVKMVVRLRTSRFGIVHGRRACKNHNLCAFLGPAPLIPGRERHPSSVEEWGEVRLLLQRLGVEMESVARTQARVALLNQEAAAINAAQVALAASKRMTSDFCDDPAVEMGGRRNNREEGEKGGVREKNNSSSNGGWKKELDLLGDYDGARAVAAAYEEANNSPSTPMQTTPTHKEGWSDAAAAVGNGNGGGKNAGSGEGVTTQSPGWSCRSFRKGQNGIYVVENA